MSIFASVLRTAYKLSGAKKAFGLPEDDRAVRRRERQHVRLFLRRRAARFEAACRRANVPYTAFARPKMVHCYCMLPVFREAKEDFAKIAEILKQ